MTISFYKSMPSWRRTIYVLGTPRSGKSTVLNLINSCENVEAVDEPYELIIMAQKGGAYLPGTANHDEYIDSFMASMENCFSELVLGRRYNFRSADASCIFRTKSADVIAAAHARGRRIDAINHASRTHMTFAVALNDIENGLSVILRDAPAPIVLWIQRDIGLVSDEIAEKGWFSNEQLATQAHVSPAYSSSVAFDGKLIYLPYFVRAEEAKTFLDLSEKERATLYYSRQFEVMSRQIEECRAQVEPIDFADVMAAPTQSFARLAAGLGLNETRKTCELLEDLEARRQAVQPTGRDDGGPAPASHDSTRAAD